MGHAFPGNKVQLERTIVLFLIALVLLCACALKRTINLTDCIGDWITITVDADSKRISCDCKQCNRNGICTWVATMMVIQFDTPVAAHCKMTDEGFGWKAKVLRVRKVMRDVNINC